MTCFPVKGLERGFRECFSPRGSPRITVNLANLLRITPKEQFVPQQNRIIVWGRPETFGAWVTRMGGSAPLQRESVWETIISLPLSQRQSCVPCAHRDQIYCTVSTDSLPFRKLFIDTAAGPDRQLPYSNCSLLSEKKPTRQELPLLLMMFLPFGEWSVLCPTYIISKTWRDSRFSLK